MEDAPPFESIRIVHPYKVVRQGAFVGAGAVIPGLIVGATYGTLRTRTPIIFSLASGAQWFAITSTFWTLRTSILHLPQLQNWYNLTRGIHPTNATPNHPSPDERARASAIAGALTGAPTALVLRGPRRVFQGTLLFALVGWAGQKAYNWLDARNSATVEKMVAIERGERAPETPVVERMLQSRWSPVKKLSDKEHKEMMGESMLKMQAELELIAAQIERLKKETEEAKKNMTKEEREQAEARMQRWREENERRRAEMTAEERAKEDERRKRFYPEPRPQ